MGTRNLTCVIKDGKFRVAQYGQWDGYPSASGIYILTFLRNVNLNKFSEQVDKTKFLSDEELDTSLKEHEIIEEFSRDTGCKILDLILLSTKDKICLSDSSTFALDGLFCEWAYVINLDDSSFEVYKGFNQESNKSYGVFTPLYENTPSEESSSYTPVVKVITYAISDLPKDEDFLKDTDPSE